jgi:uncharacterized protein YegP (UPF0339 family)
MPPSEKIVDHTEVFRGTDGLWYVHGKSDNGQVIWTSEGYVDKQWANNVALDTGLPMKSGEDNND